jgi:hypothetical protein
MLCARPGSRQSLEPDRVVVDNPLFAVHFQPVAMTNAAPLHACGVLVCREL